MNFENLATILDERAEQLDRKAKGTYSDDYNSWLVYGICSDEFKSLAEDIRKAQSREVTD